MRREEEEEMKWNNVQNLYLLVGCYFFFLSFDDYACVRDAYCVNCEVHFFLFKNEEESNAKKRRKTRKKTPSNHLLHLSFFFHSLYDHNNMEL